MPSGSSLFLGEAERGGVGGRGETSPFPNLQHPSQPPGPRLSAAARYRLSEALAAARLPLEFCPKKGALEEEEVGEEGRRPAARNGIRSPKQYGERRGPEPRRRQRL